MEGGNVEHKEGEIVAVYVKKEDIVESMDYDWSDWWEIHISPMRPTRGPWGSRRKSIAQLIDYYHIWTGARGGRASPS
jgi:hypothetical protein